MTINKNIDKGFFSWLVTFIGVAIIAVASIYISLQIVFHTLHMIYQSTVPSDGVFTLATLAWAILTYFIGNILLYLTWKVTGLFADLVGNLFG